jgi:hypothetical protein
VYAKTEADRHQCEVNFVSKNSGEWIKEFLEGVKKKRGLDAHLILREDVAKVWKNKKLINSNKE